jgi:hypothetical protein
VADVLSKYYKQLHKLHDISADAFEISDQESEGESEGMRAKLVTPHVPSSFVCSFVRSFVYISSTFAQMRWRSRV